jgi:catechol 2,3-dioxygenase-like lactoylglutathione lyase family enzyme
MISKITHCSIFVLNQDSAKDFYVNILGFELKNDVEMGPGARWITVSPKGQPDFEIILMPIVDGMMFNKEAALQVKDLVKKGMLGGAVFECEDLYATYEELKAKGVSFLKPPTQEFYKLEAVFKDDSGNWFSLGQKGSEPQN